MNPPSSVHVIAQGRVQGVGFRFFTQDAARKFGLKGWVRNLPNGDVEAEATGTRVALESWLNDLRQGPPMARVEHLEVDWVSPAEEHTQFSIR